MTESDRERAEREIGESDAELTVRERHQIEEKQRLSSLTVYSIIRREGEEELNRPAVSLWWSGVAAGMGLSASPIAHGILYAGLAGHPYRDLVSGFGYCFGFVLVILSRLQLFTENTIAVVLPVLANPDRTIFGRAARLWSIVLAANLLGCFVMALLATKAGIVSPAHLEGMVEVSTHFAALSPTEALARGIPAGFYIAAIVWMLPSAEGFEMFVIIAFSWLIIAGGFTHVVAGSMELFVLLLTGQLTIANALLSSFLPVLAGNIIGGTGLFSLLAYAQVREEM